MATDAAGNIAVDRNGQYGDCTGEVGNCGCIHAERSLLIQMPHPYAVFVSHSPCLDCAKALVAAGVVMVKYLKPYRSADGIRYLHENGVIYEGGIT